MSSELHRVCIAVSRAPVKNDNIFSSPSGTPVKSTCRRCDYIHMYRSQDVPKYRRYLHTTSCIYMSIAPGRVRYISRTKTFDSLSAQGSGLSHRLGLSHTCAKKNWPAGSKLFLSTKHSVLGSVGEAHPCAFARTCALQIVVRRTKAFDSLSAQG